MHGVLERRIMDMHIVVQNRIMDLTDDTMGPNMTMADVWSTHAKTVALELTRSAFHICKQAGCKLPAKTVEVTTKRLEEAFRAEGEDRSRTLALGALVEKATQAWAAQFENMTTIAISEAQRQSQRLRQQSQGLRPHPEVEDIASRLAHMAVIHFRVWGENAYLQPGEVHHHGIEERE
jgi:hypothetical protein